MNGVRSGLSQERNADLGVGEGWRVPCVGGDWAGMTPGFGVVSPGVRALRGRWAPWAGRGCCPACRTGEEGVLWGCPDPDTPSSLLCSRQGPQASKGPQTPPATVLSPGERRRPCCSGQTDGVKAVSIQHTTFLGQPGSRERVEPGASFCNELSGGARGGSRGPGASRAASPGPDAGRESPDSWRWPAPGPALSPTGPESPPGDPPGSPGENSPGRTEGLQ